VWNSRTGGGECATKGAGARFGHGCQWGRPTAADAGSSMGWPPACTGPLARGAVRHATDIGRAGRSQRAAGPPARGRRSATSVWGGWVTSVLGQGRAKVQEDEIRETREVRY
jgi:hypothetical protein